MRLSIVVGLAESHLEKLRDNQQAEKNAGDDEQANKLGESIKSSSQYIADLQSVPGRSR